MFNWVVKVVPQPPEAPEKDEPAKIPAAVPPQKRVKSPPLKNTDEVSEDSQAQTGVLGWLSNGFVSALPQPSGSPRDGRTTSESRSGEEGERSGVMGWVSQGLTKVLPQPDDKYKEINNTNEEHTEIYEVATMPDFDPLPHIPVVEMVSDDEESNADSLTPQFPPSVVKWIKDIMPQAVILPPGAVIVDTSPPKSSRSSLDKILSPPPESLSGISLDTDSKVSSVVGWFVSGLGLKIPQPAIAPRDDTDAAVVLQKASSRLKPDMVLEDVDSDNEGHCNAAVPSTKLDPPSPATTTTPQQQEATRRTQTSWQPPAASKLSQVCGDVGPVAALSDGVEKMSQEDAETQTGRWTPFIESIKREAEDVALATMEERLLYERMEMARMAEEVARQTAEMAIRQMASEGQSIKLSLGSAELLEEPEAGQEESLSEEEQREDTELSNLTEAAGPQRTSPSPPPSPEPVKTSEPEPKPETDSEPDPDPVTKTQEAKSHPQPVTQQPQKAEQHDGHDADKPAGNEEEATGDDCGAPVSCDAFESCLMRIPHTSECLGNINAFFKENGISPPKIPPMPKLPTQFSDVTKYFPSLPPELRQEFSRIRLTQIPRNIAQTVSELLPKGAEGAEGAEGSADPALSSLAQSFSDIPQKLSQFPARTQQYFHNVRNRLNSLMPQDA